MKLTTILTTLTLLSPAVSLGAQDDSLAQAYGKADGHVYGARVGLSIHKAKSPLLIRKYLKDSEFPEAYREAFRAAAKEAYAYVTEKRAGFHGALRGYRQGCSDRNKNRGNRSDDLADQMLAEDMPNLFIAGFKKGYVYAYKKDALKCTVTSQGERLERLPLEELMDTFR